MSTEAFPLSNYLLKKIERFQQVILVNFLLRSRIFIVACINLQQSVFHNLLLVSADNWNVIIVNTYLKFLSLQEYLFKTKLFQSFEMD